MVGYNRREKLQIQVLNTREEREHFHQDIELIYILEGVMELSVGEQKTRMEAEDILVVNANKKHSFQAFGDILFARLSIDYQLVSDIFQSVDIIFWCDSTREKSQRYEELRGTMKQLLNHYLSTRGGVRNFGHIALCYQVMDILSIHFLVQAGDREHMDETDRFEERLQQINNYIRANYSQPISLKELAEKLYLSHGYLSRFFKKNYGMSFAEYLANIRLYHAVDELLYTNAPITRIAFDNGFSSTAVFNKAFREAYGDTPSAVRKKANERRESAEKNENDLVIEERLEEFLRTDGERREKEVRLDSRRESCSVGESRKTRYSWNQMINIGAAAELLKSEVQEHVILLREALGFQYVRFWNIFSKELLIDVTRMEEDYNFSKLDSILDFLLQQGMKPHIELGMKPKRILRNVQTPLIEDNGDTIMGLEEWSRVMDALMRHLTRRYGRHELDSWRMELWFDERRWNTAQAAEEYFSLFDLVYGMIKKYSELLEVGGCGLRLDYMEHSGLEFLRKWQCQNRRPDFLSLIYFAYERGEIEQDKYSRRCTDQEGMLHRLQYADKILRKAGFEDVKLYVTEWNLSISDRNYINDTCFKGAYIIKNILDNYGQAEQMGYFLGSDRVSEYYDSNEMLHGGTGLLSKDGILKPAGFAFEFLNRLYPWYVGKGEHYLITTDRHGSYGIVCHNQKALNYNYYFTREDEVEKEHIWKYFEDREGLELKLDLTGVEDGMYHVKAYRINEKNGSILDIWKEMEYESELSRSDIKYFRRVCEPKLTIQKQETKDGILPLELTLAPNEIAFLRITKQDCA